MSTWIFYIKVGRAKIAATILKHEMAVLPIKNEHDDTFFSITISGEIHLLRLADLPFSHIEQKNGQMAYKR